jgi:hypothetical protein
MESIVTTEPTPKDKGRDRPSHPDPGSRGHIGWVVAGSLATGLVAAFLLAAAPFIPAEEPAITGAVLCGFALGWATGYNLVAVPLAAGVLAWAGLTLAPAVGAILMSASTIVVALNAQLLRRLDLRPS